MSAIENPGNNLSDKEKLYVESVVHVAQHWAQMLKGSEEDRTALETSLLFTMTDRVKALSEGRQCSGLQRDRQGKISMIIETGAIPKGILKDAMRLAGLNGFDLLPRHHRVVIDASGAVTEGDIRKAPPAEAARILHMPIPGRD